MRASFSIGAVILGAGQAIGQLPDSTTQRVAGSSPRTRAKAPGAASASIATDDTIAFDGVAPADSSPGMLAQYVGTYMSDELGSGLAVTTENGQLVLLARPADKVRLRPSYKDGFVGQGGQSVRFLRDKAGKVTGLSIYAGRVLDVRFRKTSALPKL